MVSSELGIPLCLEPCCLVDSKLFEPIISIFAKTNLIWTYLFLAQPQIRPHENIDHIVL